MVKISLIILFLCIVCQVSSQEWDSSKIGDSHKWAFRMSMNGDSLGYSIWEIKRLGEQLVLIEDSSVPNFKEDMFFYVNSSTMQPDSVLITGRLQGYPIETKARWDGNKVEGYANMPKHPSRPTMSLTQELPEGTRMRFMTFILSPFYKDLEVGSAFSYSQFNTMDGQVRNIEVKVTAEETLQVLGEAVQALKLELSGGVAEQNIYIDPKTNRIVKISFRNIEWVYELISD